MDINEKKKDSFSRHPWELSRTACVIKDIQRFINCRERMKYINIGAGDLFFDKVWIEKYTNNHFVSAVDIGYDSDTKVELNPDSCSLYRDINEVAENKFNYAIMMDSLEYMEDDAGYLSRVSKKLEDNGIIILTVPAFSSLYSQYDVNVGNLRRYSKKDLIELIAKIPEVEIEYSHYFYSSLLLVRLFQKNFGIQFAPHEEVTTGWNYKENSVVTRAVIFALNVDYNMCKLFGAPGLSLFAVCRKKQR